MSLPPCCAPLELRPLPSAGVTRLLRYYEPLRHPAGPGWSSRFPGWRVRATDAASRVAAVSLFTHAAANTPAEPVGARVTRFPTAVSLPRIVGGSASALSVSRPAQRSLALRPACSLNRPEAILLHRSASVQFVTSLHRSDCFRLEQQLPGGIRTRWDTAPFHGARTFPELRPLPPGLNHFRGAWIAYSSSPRSCFRQTPSRLLA